MFYRFHQWAVSAEVGAAPTGHSYVSNICGLLDCLQLHMDAKNNLRKQPRPKMAHFYVRFWTESNLMLLDEQLYL